MSPEAFNILSQNTDLFPGNNNLILYCVRIIGWCLIKGLAFIVNEVEKAVNELTSHLDFFRQIMGDDGLLHSLHPVLWALFGIGVTIIGFQLIMNRSKGKAHIPMNLVIVMVVIFGMPTFLFNLSNITENSVDLYMSGNASLTNNILKGSVQDLKYIADNDFTQDAKDRKNNFADDLSQIQLSNAINPLELAKPNEYKHSDVFKYILVYDQQGKPNINLYKELGDGFMGIDMLSSYYYRYRIFWFDIIMSFLALLIALVFTGIKVAKIIFEIAYNGIFTAVIAPLDVSGGVRTKKCIMEIINLFAVLISIAFLFKLYCIAFSWGSITFHNTIASLLWKFGVSGALIGGPNIVQKILGIDAGLGNELQKAASAIYMVKQGAGMIGGAIKSVGHAAGKVGHTADKIGKFSSAAAGAINGNIKAISDYNDEKQADKMNGKDKTENNLSAAAELDKKKNPSNMDADKHDTDKIKNETPGDSTNTETDKQQTLSENHNPSEDSIKEDGAAAMLDEQKDAQEGISDQNRSDDKSTEGLADKADSQNQDLANSKDNDATSPSKKPPRAGSAMALDAIKKTKYGRLYDKSLSTSGKLTHQYLDAKEKRNHWNASHTNQAPTRTTPNQNTETPNSAKPPSKDVIPEQNSPPIKGDDEN